MYNIHCIFNIVNMHFIFMSSYDWQTCVEPCSRVSIIPAGHLCPVVIITHSQLYMFHQQSLVKVPSSHQSVEQQQLSQLDPFFACSDFVLSWSPARYRWHLWGLSSKAWLISTAATWAPTKSTLVTLSVEKYTDKDTLNLFCWALLLGGLDSACHLVMEASALASTYSSRSFSIVIICSQVPQLTWYTRGSGNLTKR